MSPSLALLSLLCAAKVDQVVVFPDRAQVTRAASVACGPRAQVIFEGIPPAADPASFRARAAGAQLEGLRSEQLVREQLFGPELAAVAAEIRKLEHELASVRHERERAELRAKLGNDYAGVAAQLVSREMSEPRPDPKAWSAAFELALSARLEAAQQLVGVQARLRELGHRLDDLRRKQARLSAAAQRKEHRAEVLVSCPEGKSAQVELTYLVGGALWEPAYEARAEEQEGMVELSTYATVRQATGEDWEAVRLVLSTALPAENATPPELSPLHVYAEERKDEKKVLVRREERVQHAEVGAAGAAGEAGLGARAQGLSVQLEVPERSDVPGDGAPVRLLVGRARIKAAFAFRSAPKLAPFVFRVADLTNSAPYPLLPGPLDAFRRGSFIARYPLARVPEGGLFHLTFGLEESLRVQRTVLEEVQREAGLFGGKRRFRYGYRFELANFGPRPAEVELTEHVPVSELEEVRVEIGPKTTGGYQLKSPEGIASWRLKLSPSEKRKVELSFHLEVPSSFDSAGL